MPRHHAPLLTSIWDDDDFCDLPARAQRLYMQILSQKRLSMAGVVPFSARNLARGCGELGVEEIEADLAILTEREYVFVDRDTDELMVRTILKYDPPRGEKSIAGMWNAWREIDSDTIKRRVVHSVSDEIWGHEKAFPPEEAKALRNAPSDGASDARNRATAAIGHLPPSTVRPPASVSDSHPPTGSTGADDQSATKKINDVTEHIVTHRIEAGGKQVGKGYRVKVERDVTTAKGNDIARLVGMFPNAPVSLLAHGAETGDTRNLAHYAQPATESAEPEQHLSRAEREALIDSNKTDTEDA